MHLFIRNTDIAAHRRAQRALKWNPKLFPGGKPSGTRRQHAERACRACLRQIFFDAPPQRAVTHVFSQSQQHNQCDDCRAEIAETHGCYLIPSLGHP